MISLIKLIKLAKQFLPSGRAFKVPKDGDLDLLINALSQSEKRLRDDADSIFDSEFPDNDDFSEDDATIWERRLGLITADGVSLDDRKKAIIRKMNHPGDIPSRQSARFLERELRLAGFDVYVWENIFPPDGDPQDPLTVSGGIGGVPNQFGDNELGDAQLGSGYVNLVANHIDEDKDAIFDVGPTLRFTFFIGGTPVGQFASVPQERKDEFRELILKVKPVENIAYLFVNYV